MCGIGLSVTRPRLRAVGSPSRSATQAWAASWLVMDRTTNTMVPTIVKLSMDPLHSPAAASLLQYAEEPGFPRCFLQPK